MDISTRNSFRLKISPALFVSALAATQISAVWLAVLLSKEMQI